MRRRDFIRFLGGAIAIPVAARAQQGERARLIGMLNILGKDDPEAKVRLTIFQQLFSNWDGRSAAISKSKVAKLAAISIAFAVTPQN